MEADEEGTLNRLRSIRAEFIDPKIAEHRGRIVKTTGDGLLVEFSSVVDALRCATEWQHGMHQRNAAAPGDNRIKFRIGVHQGKSWSKSRLALLCLTHHRTPPTLFEIIRDTRSIPQTPEPVPPAVSNVTSSVIRCHRPRGIDGKFNNLSLSFWSDLSPHCSNHGSVKQCSFAEYFGSLRVF